MRLVLASILALAWPAMAQAQSYCSLSPFQNCDGCEVTTYGKVVVSSVPRAPIPGRPADRPWCSFTFVSGGGAFRAPTILKKPTLGTLDVRSPNHLMYKSDRVGRDRFVIERYWNHPATGREQTTRITYEIEVVGAPM